MSQSKLFLRICHAIARHRRNTHTSSGTSREKSAIMFPGQGTQKIGMTAPLLKAFPSAKYVLDEIDAKLGFRLSHLILSGSPDELIKTENAQPAIVATGCCILYILEKELGVTLINHINYALGHSLGEFTSLVAAGVVTGPDAALLVHERGKSMAMAIASISEETLMIALIVEKGRVPDLINNVENFSKKLSVGICQIANINSDDQLVLSGTRQALADCIDHLRRFSGHDPRAIPLATAGPFHTNVMGPTVKIVSDLLNQISVSPPKVPIIMNVTAEPVNDVLVLKTLLTQQAVKPVLWWKSVEYLRSQNVQRYITIGPGNVIRNLVGKQVGKTKVIGCSSVEEIIDLGNILRQ
ncbi:Malonyl CoA-acyl carrier protein transacylase [Neolecta irregularis DAH-3]|uniref:[acyl-carrier-protein] S-malonyltransferase n=1 Tax=Neolecta irregularis (strain DAH-3) TaxID=1198029 RepID=A0A1U7LU05_NEOID|nr:Malonyl CoA-acyl carrier protein transacylase [Neolecta irregularis DAH-3]|eukprot:OLL26156.1 Malonyl CoA-acyl carrier protein transacylase [Neolecta irregularis DAH-3]